MAEATTITTPTRNKGTNETLTRYCIICSEVASNTIKKDKPFSDLLGLYWSAISADVKPDWNQGFYLCLPCYEKLLGFYETKEVMQFYEATYHQQVKELLLRNLQGIVSWPTKGLRLLPFQSQILTEWGGKQSETEEQDQKILSKFEVNHSKMELEVTDDEDCNVVVVNGTTATNGDTSSPKSNHSKTSPQKRAAQTRAKNSRNKKPRGKNNKDGDSDSGSSNEDVVELGPVVHYGGRSTRPTRKAAAAVANANKSNNSSDDDE